jgi:glucose/arabinose dehydrogenase
MHAATRRRLLASTATAVVGGLAGCTGGGDDDSAGGPIPEPVALEPITTDIEAPVDMAFAPDADRRYLLEQGGRIRVHEASIRAEPFLDLGDSVATSGNEMGLLGIALHPDFASNRRVFVRYSAPRREGTPDSYSHTFVLAEFEATADGRQVVAGSEQPLLELPQPQGNHNAGDILFGPDGLLYVAVGDGGAGGDQGTGHVEDWYEAVPGGNGQDVTDNLLGSILRLDVDAGGDGYAVPEDNPLVGSEGRDEHYAWGLRNPYGLAFDGTDFFVADVGQNAYEEVNLVEAGGNYGWNVREGTHCYSASECPDSTPGDVRGGQPLISPIIEYPHPGADAPVTGSSVIGGTVYRGSALPALDGVYVFADLAARDRLFTATQPETGSGLWPIESVDVAGTLRTVRSFAQDRDGEVYVLGTGPAGSGCYRIAPSG